MADVFGWSDTLGVFCKNTIKLLRRRRERAGRLEPLGELRPRVHGPAAIAVARARQDEGGNNRAQDGIAIDARGRLFQFTTTDVVGRCQKVSRAGECIRYAPPISYPKKTDEPTSFRHTLDSNKSPQHFTLSFSTSQQCCRHCP